MNDIQTKAPIIEVSLQEPEWEKIKDIEKIIHQAVERTLNTAMMPKTTINRDLEVSIVLANDDLIQVLNREYREKNTPTNVLTFATLDSEEIPTDGVLNLGDIILSFQTIQREAQEQGKFVLDHVKHMTIHGVLHLLGYDHINDDEANDMETLEISILTGLGVQNPYTDMDL